MSQRKVQFKDFCKEKYDENGGTLVIFFEGCLTNNQGVLTPNPALIKAMETYFVSFSQRAIGVNFRYKEKFRVC